MLNKLQLKLASLVLLAATIALFINTPSAKAGHCSPTTDPVCAHFDDHKIKSSRTVLPM